jgi:hemolysin activation/secretion protein
MTSPRTSHPARGRTPDGTVLILAAAAALLSIASAAAAPVPAAPRQEIATTAADQVEATEADGPRFPIRRLSIRYLRENPLHPPIEEVMHVRFSLLRTTSGLVAPRRPMPGEETSLAELREGDYHASALQHILEAVRDYYVQQADLLGVYVAPDPTQILDGVDRRPAGSADLTLLVTTGIVTELRTIGAGERIGEKGTISAEERIDHPVHDRIRARSPFQPYSMGDEARNDLLKRTVLDDYLFWLGRHPGRRVDASIAVAEDVGGIALDYHVTENRPLVLYAQAANTGTRATDQWQERFGFFHTQLTGNDDILGVDYTTAGFDSMHAVQASYEAPFENDRIRWRVHALWSQYTASDVGLFNVNFDGDQWALGGEVIANVYQQRELFVDLLGGVRFDDIGVENSLFGIDAEESFVSWYVGTRLDRTTEWFSTRGQVAFEWQIGGVTGVEDAELVGLGRTNPDADWLILRWDLGHSVYLEPLLNWAEWVDPSLPESATLAHELRFLFRGQYAFDRRIIPQFQSTAGGSFTVRGYPESIVAGDTVLIGTAEYRFHVPRAFRPRPEPDELFGEPFRVAPQFPYGLPDWDLVLKTFVDVGEVIISDQLFFEDDTSLLGIGVGFDLLYRRNLQLRVDWGFVIEDIPSRDVNDWSNRVHVVATLLF